MICDVIEVGRYNWMVGITCCFDNNKVFEYYLTSYCDVALNVNGICFTFIVILKTLRKGLSCLEGVGAILRSHFKWLF